jgi:two-component system nitrogen regulation response regulator GlnG
MSRILIVDDEASISWAFREFLSAEGHEVEVAASAEEALDAAGRCQPDAIVLDVRLPRMDGLTAMRLLRERVGPAPIVVITAFGNLDTAVRAIEGGAFEYLIKPFDLEQAGAVVNRALAASHRKSRRASGVTIEPDAEDQNGDRVPDYADMLVGSSPVMQLVFKRIALVAAAEVPVLITGESGTGKELVARAIHRHSRRRNGPFLPVSLPALNPSLVESELFGHVRGAFTGASQDRTGLLELAAGGTVFLDEIADTTPALQVKLLRAVEHREITPVGDARTRATDFRVVAATNRPLGSLIAAGQFREDLFFRLSVFHIHLPPLRERSSDVVALAEYFARVIAGSSESAWLTDDARAELEGRSWPGNVRELRNAIEHAVIVARGCPIRTEHFPPAMAAAATATPHVPLEQELARLIRDWTLQGSATDEDSGAASGELYTRWLGTVEPPLLRAALSRCGSNRAATAELLGMNRATLREKLRRYGIE